ncbi:MAG: PAS domain-containing protein [Gemmatimonadaceae bacterium]|nr:PAS domain-containing protein [Gemmatimonadaceae bacterium]
MSQGLPQSGPPMNADVIVRHIVAGFFLVDADWMVRLGNPRASTLLRRPLSDIEGKALWDAIPGLRNTSAADKLMSSGSGTIERRTEFFSPTLYNWFEIWCVPDGPDVRYVFFTDVTDRARAMQSDAVRESLRHILMDAPVAITVTKGADHRLEMINTAARALLGDRNLEGLTLRAALPEVDSKIFELIDGVFETGEPVTMRDLVVTYDRNGDGHMYTGTFDVTYLPLRSTSGEIEGTIQTAVETTRYTAAPAATT